MPDELGVPEQRVAPHQRDFFGWVAETWTQAEGPDAELRVSVVDGDAQGGADLVAHELFFLLEGVFFARAVELGPFDGTDGDDGEG